MRSIGQEVLVAKDMSRASEDVPDRVPVRDRMTGETRMIHRVDAKEILTRFGEAYEADAEVRELLKIPSRGDE